MSYNITYKIFPDASNVPSMGLRCIFLSPSSQKLKTLAQVCGIPFKDLVKKFKKAHKNEYFLYPTRDQKDLIVLFPFKEKKFSFKLWNEACQKCVSLIKSSKVESILIEFDFSLKAPLQKNFPFIWTAWIEEALQVRYGFFSEKNKTQDLAVQYIFPWQEEMCRDLTHKISSFTEGLRFSKELADCPPNICTPTFLAQKAVDLHKVSDLLDIKILEQEDMQHKNMHAILTVARGSIEPPKFIEIHYNRQENVQPIILIGKGVTFDSGGLCLKPSRYMEDMKYDMCGAAVVLGLLKTLALEVSSHYVIALIPCVENLPGRNAMRPGDVITTMAGKTVEIMDTDAEGRLILCDALTYAEEYNPAAVIDLATLTGAVEICLGDEAAAILSNSQSLSRQLEHSGEISYDRVWPLPLWEEYDDLLKSPIADFQNVEKGRSAGCIVGGVFLSYFSKKYKWAHIDIAGVAHKTTPYYQSTGRPFPLLFEYFSQTKIISSRR